MAKPYEGRLERIHRLSVGIAEAYTRDALVRHCMDSFIEGSVEYEEALEEAVIQLRNDRARLMEELMKREADRG